MKATKKEDTSTESFDSKTLREISHATAMKKGNSKNNLQIWRCNSNLRRALSKTNVQNKTLSMKQQLDIRNKQNTFCTRKALTSERDDTQKMHEQIKTRTSEITKLKDKDSNNE